MTIKELRTARTFLKYAMTLLVFSTFSVRSHGAILPHQPDRIPPARSGSTSQEIGGAGLEINFEGVQPDLPRDCIARNIWKAAQAVTTYYGKFPVSSARIVIVVAAGQHGVLQGTTWGNRDGFPAVTRLRIGQHTTQQELDANWIVTHELVHMALASLPDNRHWLEEGIATYVEPIARAQTGELKSERVWADMMDGMPYGEPEPFDRGLNRTHTWGRIYWGGAMFCLVADVEIRKQTNNRYGLQDALRAIVAIGGTIDKQWSVARVLRVGDEATGTSVLQDLYRKWSETPVHVDLPVLWKNLGVQIKDGRVIFNATAPLSRTRLAITMPPSPSAEAKPSPGD